jgi:hypothetical protein
VTLNRGKKMGKSHALESGPERLRAESATESKLIPITAAMPHLGEKAEGGGFEPPSEENPRNGFRDRRIRPLCHPSAAEATKRGGPDPGPRRAGAVRYDRRPGEVSERPKERDWKSRRRDLSSRGFKSLPLR